MKYIDWDRQKNEKLKSERDIGFEDILLALEENRVLDIIPNHNVTSHPRQNILIVDVSGYAYLVPFAEDPEKIFLKTIIPSRKATKKYIIKPKQ